MCYCAAVLPFVSDPEFVILIHPKETRKAINTGRMAFLNIQNSRLLLGADFSENEAVNALLEDPSRRCYLLFPGPLAVDLPELPECAEGIQEVFLILDATWSMAKKMLRLSKNLQTLPQVMFHPPHASEFLIRQQPGLICFSTIETIHHLIEKRGRRHDGKHHHLLTLFREMVQKQIECEGSGS